MKTIDIIKKKRTVSADVLAKRKEFARIKKIIKNTLKEGAKSIPQIAEETKLPFEVVTFNLMTCRKYGEVEVEGIDDMDEFFFYKLKQKE